MAERPRPAPWPARCPVCGKPAPPREGAARAPSPFCSERCRQVDLGRWLTGAYALPAEEDEDEARAEEA